MCFRINKQLKSSMSKQVGSGGAGNCFLARRTTLFEKESRDWKSGLA
jgi:hypothetical protein